MGRPVILENERDKYQNEMPFKSSAASLSSLDLLALNYVFTTLLCRVSTSAAEEF